MQNAVPVGNGKMIAVLGLETLEIQNLIDKQENKKGICEIANDNAVGQVIISGDKETIDNIQLDFKEKKIKTIPLKVSAPFHCSLMKPAAEKMRPKIDNTSFKKGSVKIVNNVTANEVDDPTQIKKLLVDQIFFNGKMEREHYFYEKIRSPKFCRNWPR